MLTGPSLSCSGRGLCLNLSLCHAAAAWWMLACSSSSMQHAATACSVCVHACVRANKLCLPSKSDHTPSMSRSRSEVSRDYVHTMRLRRTSKCLPGVIIFLPLAQSSLFPCCSRERVSCVTIRNVRYKYAAFDQLDITTPDLQGHLAAHRPQLEKKSLKVFLNTLHTLIR